MKRMIACVGGSLPAKVLLSRPVDDEASDRFDSGNKLSCEKLLSSR
jgi:hypothetical protein